MKHQIQFGLLLTSKELHDGRPGYLLPPVSSSQLVYPLYLRACHHCLKIAGHISRETADEFNGQSEPAIFIVKIYMAARQFNEHVKAVFRHLRPKVIDRLAFNRGGLFPVALRYLPRNYARALRRRSQVNAKLGEDVKAGHYGLALLGM